MKNVWQSVSLPEPTGVILSQYFWHIDATACKIGLRISTILLTE